MAAQLAHLLCSIPGGTCGYSGAPLGTTCGTLFAQKLSRKLVHITAGPLFVLMWPLFSWAPNARLYAAVIPALNSLR